jgi:hypothetical protein
MSAWRECSCPKYIEVVVPSYVRRQMRQAFGSIVIVQALGTWALWLPDYCNITFLDTISVTKLLL